MKRPKRSGWVYPPEAETFVTDRLTQALQAMPQVPVMPIAQLSHTVSWLADWLDQLVLSDDDLTEEWGYRATS
jgi:hypothetical protein